MKLPPFAPSRRAAARAIGSMFVIAAAVVLSGCSITRPSPVKRTYLLEPALPSPVAAAKPVTLRMGTITVGAAYRGRQLVYRADELKFEADFYSEFFVAPAAMIAESTSRALSSAKVFRRVIPPGAAPDEGDYLLDGFVNDLYADARNGAKAEAMLSITYYLSSLTAAGNTTVVWSHDYQQRVPLGGTNADAVVRAWNTGLTSILAELARDLAAADLTAK